jgi:hypothetical protein
MIQTEIIKLANLKLKDGGSKVALHPRNHNAHQGKQLLDERRKAILEEAMVLQEVSHFLGRWKEDKNGRPDSILG